MINSIQPKGRNLCRDIGMLRVGSTLHIRGRAIDDYDDEYKVNLDKHGDADESIKRHFNEIWIGNKLASVKFELINVLWSKLYSNRFCLEVSVAQQGYNSNNLLLNNVLHLMLNHEGTEFVEVSSELFRSEFLGKRESSCKNGNDYLIDNREW